MMQAKKIAGIVVLLILIAMPFGANRLFSDFYVALFLRVFIFGILLIGFDLLAGYGGLVSFGHAMFFGTGAYTAALVWKYVSSSVWLGIFLGLGLNGIIGYLLAILCVRTRAIYFVFLTFAFSQFFYEVAHSWRVIGGSDGIPGIPPPTLLPGISLGSRLVFYYFCLACLVFAFWVAQRIVNSHFGRVLESVRENEERAKFLGYDTTSLLRRTFLISGLFASLAGALMAGYQPFVSPSYYHWSLSGEFVMMEILGGMGTLVGPLLGTAVVILMGDFLSTWFKEAWILCLGFVYVLCVLYSPRGLAVVLKNPSVMPAIKSCLNWVSKCYSGRKMSL